MPNCKVPRHLPAKRPEKGLQTDLQNEIVQEIETLLGHTAPADLDFEAIEMAARRQALRLAAHALAQRLNADTSDHVGAELPCACGATAQYHGRHTKTFESVLGLLKLARAYYYCKQCQSGFCPRDRDLRLELFSLTRGSAHDRQCGSARELRREQWAIARFGGHRGEHEAGRTSC